MKHLKALFFFFAKGIASLALLLFFVFMFVEWMAGCGEVYKDSKGILHKHECVFIKR